MRGLVLDLRFQKGDEMKKTEKRRVKEIKPILAKIKDYLKDRYRDKVQRIVLYGSFAKGQANTDSDVDIAVIIKNDLDPREIEDGISELLFEILLDYGELVAVSVLPEEKVRDSIWPIYRSIERDGIKL